MKDIKAIINEHAADLSDEAKEAIVADVKSNYKTAAEMAKKMERIEELTSQVDALSEQAQRIDGDAEEIEKLRAQVQKYRDAEDKRKEAEKESAKRDEFRKSFDEALGDRRFANSIVEASVFEQAYSACGDATGKGVKDAIAEIVGDSEGVWVNPQTDKAFMPALGQLDSTAATDEARKKSFAEALFGPPRKA